MKIIKTYVADDGTRFDNEYDCITHEEILRSNQFSDTAFLFDKQGNKLPLTCDAFGDAYFIVCKTKEAAEYLKDEFGGTWENPWMHNPVGKEFWVYFGDSWYSAETLENIINLAHEVFEKTLQ